MLTQIRENAPARSRKVSHMLAILGVLGAVLGLALALLAPRVPTRQPVIAKWGGGLFIAGLALLGTALPIL